MNNVSAGYFAAIGTPLVAGRTWTAADRDGKGVAIVNQTFARRYFGSESALGRTIWLRASEKAAPNPPLEIVGIARDAAYASLKEAVPPTVYMATIQEEKVDSPDATFALRYQGPERDARVRTTELIGSVNRGITVEYRTIAEALARNTQQDRLLAQLSGGFGLLALVIAAVGVYGLLSYSVAQRRGEIGIRLALGAQPGAVVKTVVNEAVWPLLLGVASGVGLVLLGGRYLQSLLFGLSPADPATIAVSAALLVVTALGASFLPARRAARLDPLHSLRCE